MYLCRHSFDQRFVSKLRDIEDKYGKEMFEIDGIGESKLDINRFSDNFLQPDSRMSNLSVDKNANLDDNSIMSFDSEFIKALQRVNAYYILWKNIGANQGITHAKKILELCINGNLKIHDLHFLLKPYCYAFSLSNLVHNGMPFVKKVKIKNPKRFKSFVNLVIQFVAYVSNNIAGACALPDLFFYMDWYLRKDFGENYLDKEENVKIIKQELQSLVYSFNFPFRSAQSAFVNVSVYDDYFLKDLFGDSTYPDFTYVNFDSIKKLQQFYMEWFIEETKVQTLTFPINTATIYKNDDNQIQDEQFLNLVSELNSINGNFNIYIGPLGSLSSCCRLRNDTTKTKEYTNSLGAGGISIGSHRVVTLNLPRIALESLDIEDFIKNLEDRLGASSDILDTHRFLLQDLILNRKLPLYTYGFMDLKKQFSTIGFIGLNECIELLGKDITNDDGLQLGKRILDLMNKHNEKKTKNDGHIRNIEQIPGESAASDFAKKDKILFSANPYTIYSNQYIPLWKISDVQDRIRLAGEFDSQCSGGAILHINLNEAITKDQMKELIIYSANKGIIYFAINVAQIRCRLCQKLHIGKFDKSPCCGADVEKYLRIVGYLTSVESWSSARQIEYKTRQFYNSDIF